MIRRRHVFHIAGYDPLGAPRQHRSFARQAAIFTKTWNVTATVSELQQPSEASSPRWTINTAARNWQVETVYEPLMWDDIVLADMAKPMAMRLGRSAGAFVDFVGSGAVSRYFRAYYRYGLF